MQIQIAGESGSFSLTAKLVVLAEGGRSKACDWLGIQQQTTRYEQCALVANVSFEHPHRCTAFERFTEQGPLALLPLPDYEGEPRGALVWTLPESESESIRNLEDAMLLQQLQERFGMELGSFKGIGK